MKYNILFLIIFCIITSCERKVDVEVPFEKERLVIEASINWFDGTTGNEQEIKLTKTAPYFNTIIPPALNAIVTIEDSNNNLFNFIDTNNTGVYKTTNFIPVLNETYTLTILYNNEIYRAKETLKSVTPIDYIEQKNDGGFSGDEIELKAYYTDPANEENFYFYEFDNPNKPVPVLEVYDDEFTNGNQIFAFYTDEKLEINMTIVINNYGVSKQFYEYMDLLLQQVSDSGGGPFETQPSTVKGNCVNITNNSNFALGYFKLSQAYKTTYIIE